MEEVETITLTLEAEETDGLPGYYPFAPTEHTVYVKDNDALWSGSLFRPLADTAVTVDFRMKITRQGGMIIGKLVTDGIGIIPVNPASPVSDESEWSEWPMEVSTYSETISNPAFEVSVEGLPIHAINSATTGETIIPEMTRSLSFTGVFVVTDDPDDSDDGPKIEPIIKGDFTEQVVCGTFPQLGYETSGTFFLQKRIAIVDTSQILSEE